ncbi:palmitoyltransferase DHHC10, putative [Plasmodium chabaudi chabaudi]|uniref:Palmitoyltransferase n=2 Tax=Plasmodium chabaudi TaxID=5825 RepID=A0A4V0K3I7_PLACU|nr:palmitoyltransferase DHHC10, putative [Plasmodium chabaudi chabaudi]SCM03008.1 palmitoyltransferase, putative [Plasmodium chabaudi adami]VTZ67458.1 palmitoyltransferase DHHC10, putative [Plasmodium chabaudi chabaudi]|eukprot:XP_016655192.1 palmitoyltransferase, putative [Plasmodium chabaudi chabaudi]
MNDSKNNVQGIRHLLPVMLICFVTIVMYTIFVTFYCFLLLQVNVESQYVDEALLKDGYITLFTFHAILFLMIWSFYKTYNTSPGYVPNTHEWRVEPDVKRIKEREKTGELRYCPYSKVYKPDRSHYCRAIDKTVLKMDHYCPWVANCIGFYNYKFFLLSLLYANICCFYVGINCYSSFPYFYTNPNILFNEVFYLFLEIVLSAVIILIIFPFFLFHLYLTSQNYTTLEFCVLGEKAKQNIYNLGIEENFKQVLGENILTWLLPIGKPKGNGLFYKTL